MLQTGGFGVNVMPQYTPVDPKLVAFNPDALSNGILKAFDVATADEKLQAFKMQQDELNQLRDDRIAQAHAHLQDLTGESLSRIQLRPRQTENTAFADQTLAALNPGVRSLALGTQGSAIRQQPAQLGMAEAKTASDAALQPQKLATEANAAQVNYEVGNQNVDQLDTTLATSAANAELARIKAEHEVEAFPGDTARAQALTQAKIDESAAKAELDHAQAFLATNHGTYFDYRSHLPPQVRDKTSQDLSANERNMNAELNRTLDNGMTVREYKAKFAAQPNWMQNAWHSAFGGTSYPNHDEGGDKALVNLAELQAQKDDIIHEASVYRANNRAATAKPSPVAIAASIASGAVGEDNSPPVTVRYPGAGGVSTPAANQNIYDAPAQPSALPHYSLAQTSTLPPDLQDAWGELQDNPNDPNGPALVQIIDKVLAQQAAGGH